MAAPARRRPIPAAVLAKRERFIRARKAEHDYSRHLRKVARHIGDIARTYFGRRAWRPELLGELVSALERYGEALEPWARAIGRRMLAEVQRRDEQAWFEAANEMGRNIRHELRSAPTGRLAQELLDAQVALIKSLPIEAARRIQRLALQAINTGRRAEELTEDVMRTGEVTQARAELIARTETSRAQSVFTQARAEHLGSTHYIWRTGKDGNVRDSHKKLEGTVHRWNDPPISDPPAHRANPGCIWNCRCYAEPVFED